MPDRRAQQEGLTARHPKLGYPYDPDKVRCGCFLPGPPKWWSQRDLLDKNDGKAVHLGFAKVTSDEDARKQKMQEAEQVSLAAGLW